MKNKLWKFPLLILVIAIIAWLFFEGWEKIILLFIAFLAIMGYLPYTLIIKSWLPNK